MVLKRIFVTALGALGLSALATGPTFAQQVPAPDFFGDQIACSSANAGVDVPDPLASTAPNMMGPSLLEQALRGSDGMGDPRKIDLAPQDTQNSLNFVIDATEANCGSGTAFGTDDANYQLATGYTDVLKQFQAVVTEEGKVKRAQAALRTAIEGTIEGQIEDAREDLEEAQADLATEQAKLNAVGAGPIYQAGIAEWRAKARVDAAITDWDEAVPEVTDARVELREAEYDNYVELPGQDLLDRLTNDAGDLQRSAVANYIGEETNGATLGFDENQELIILEENDVPVETPTDVSDIMDNSAAADRAVTALEEAIADSDDEVQRTRLGEALRRARLEKAHLNEYLRRALNDNTEQRDNPDTAAEDYELDSIRVRNAAYRKAVGERDDAEAELQAAVAARAAATKAVQDAFQGPGSYFDQYVYRHNYLTSQEQKDVNDAIAEGRTPTKTETDALADAQKARDEAVAARDRYQTMVADSDNPAVNLIGDLLVPDTKKGDDDGQALVDAVSDTYEVAKDARDTANRVADEVSGLTGDGGDVATNTADIKTNTDNIATNADNIATNTESIEMLDGRVTQNEGDIASNTMMIGENSGRIATNATNIATNAGHIMENTGMIETNAGNIMTNAGNIMTNADNIMTNAGNIAMNTTSIEANMASIGTNADAIAANMNSIGSNASAISDNRNMIGELSDDLDVVRAGVAASMALAGMPAINGRGISIGVGSFESESAFAVGFQIQGEMASFKVGVTSASGATGASAGVGFQF